MNGRSSRPAPYPKSALIPIRRVGSSRITIIGRHKAPSTLEELRRPPLLPAQPLRIPKTQLAKLQHRDIASDELLTKNRLTLAQQADLHALQQEISGDYSSGSFEYAPDSLSTEEVVDLDDVDSSGEDDGWEDEMAIIEDLELPQGSQEWTNRLATEHATWLEQLPMLCDAYLGFRSKISTPGPDSPAKDISVQCINLFDQRTTQFQHPDDELWVNVTLLRHGYLAPTPSRPSIAFSLELLDVLAAVLRRGPSVSIQIMAKAFCDLRNVPYKRYYRNQLTAALDTYHMIRKAVQRQLDIALGRGSTDWRLLNSCTACTYKLQDEPTLRYTILVTCDGNDSAKRCANAGTADHRPYNSNYHISRSQVDLFKNEVPSRRKTGESVVEDTVCEKRWKNAQLVNRPDRQPKTVFSETGIFISTCRHSMILTVCDMISSGEQAKYGLSTIDKLITAFGSNILMGYDIGCTFKGTSSRSPLLGPRVRESGFDMCVGSFHGPAHNRACQIKNHPHNRPGAGLTDFENCETVFSSSNRVAGTTRLASPYHRLQRIDIHFDGWDDDQYANLGYLLRSKYIAALKVIDVAEATIQKLNPRVSSNDLERYATEEGAYLESMKSEDPEDVFAIHYVELLERLNAKQLEYDQCKDAWVASDGRSLNDLRRATLTTARIEARRRTTLDQLHTLQDEADKMEDKHGIRMRWTRGSREWENAQRIRRNRQFQLCIDELERLVVQRLLELSRAGLANTGYKLRMHIMKALAVRSAAIKASLARYNKAAAELDHPAPSISWDTVADVSVLADFDLLRGSRYRILEQEWARPENRRCVEQHRRLQRAHEEIERLNIEVRRVWTSVTDEEHLLQAAARCITQDDPHLGWAAQRYVARRLEVNKGISHQLALLRCLPGYSGSHSVGVRQGLQPISDGTPNVSRSSADRADDISLPIGSLNDDPEPHDDGINAPHLDDADDEIYDRFDRLQSVLDKTM